MEEWRDIAGFDGYQVSNKGRVRSFWKKKHYPKGYGTYRSLSNQPTIMSQSDDGNGYLKLMLYDKKTGKRYCRKTHRLVAEAFLNKPDDAYTVDHIESGAKGKLNNNVSNLRWMSRRENIQKAYRDGMCDERIHMQQKSVIATDLFTGENFYFSNIGEAALELGLNRTSISHVLRGDKDKISHYIFEYADKEDDLLYGNDEYKAYQRFSWL